MKLDMSHPSTIAWALLVLTHNILGLGVLAEDEQTTAEMANNDFPFNKIAKHGPFNEWWQQSAFKNPHGAFQGAKQQLFKRDFEPDSYSSEDEQPSQLLGASLHANIARAVDAGGDDKRRILAKAHPIRPWNWGRPWYPRRRPYPHFPRRMHHHLRARDVQEEARTRPHENPDAPPSTPLPPPTSMPTMPMPMPTDPMDMPSLPEAPEMPVEPIEPTPEPLVAQPGMTEPLSTSKAVLTCFTTTTLCSVPSEALGMQTQLPETLCSSELGAGAVLGAPQPLMTSTLVETSTAIETMTLTETTTCTSVLVATETSTALETSTAMVAVTTPVYATTTCEVTMPLFSTIQVFETTPVTATAVQTQLLTDTVFVTSSLAGAAEAVAPLGSQTLPSYFTAMPVLPMGEGVDMSYSTAVARGPSVAAMEY